MQYFHIWIDVSYVCISVDMQNTSLKVGSPILMVTHFPTAIYFLKNTI